VFLELGHHKVALYQISRFGTHVSKITKITKITKILNCALRRYYFPFILPPFVTEQLSCASLTRQKILSFLQKRWLIDWEGHQILELRAWKVPGMSGQQPDMISILNNDDNPAFAVRPATRTSTSRSEVAVGDYPRPNSRVSRHVQYDSFSAVASSAPQSQSFQRPYDHHWSTPGARLEMSSSYGREHVHYRTSSGANSELGSPIEASSPGSIYSNSASVEANTSQPGKKNKYPCPYAVSHGCTATFTTSGHAARHGKKHTGEKSVQCPICNKVFTRKDNMKQHKRTHRTQNIDMDSQTENGKSASRDHIRGISRSQSEDEPWSYQFRFYPGT
jgi:hypothetical protein